MGCAVACIAGLTGLTYDQIQRLFNENKSSTKGYDLKEISSTLKKKKLYYKGSKVNDLTKKYLKIPGSIVFIRRSKKYPAGHYLLRTKQDWMNSWINYPKIAPAKAGFMKRLPGEAQWILYKKD